MRSHGNDRLVLAEKVTMPFGLTSLRTSADLRERGTAPAGTAIPARAAPLLARASRALEDGQSLAAVELLAELDAHASDVSDRAALHNARAEPALACGMPLAARRGFERALGLRPSNFLANLGLAVTSGAIARAPEGPGADARASALIRRAFQRAPGKAGVRAVQAALDALQLQVHPASAATLAFTEVRAALAGQRRIAPLAAEVAVARPSSPAPQPAGDARPSDPVRDRANPVVQIEDLQPEEGDFRNFRTSPELRQSGSSQFTHAGLVQIRDKIHAMAPDAEIVVVDLREESHGIAANGRPISWRNEHDWANLGKTTEEITADEAKRLDAVGATTEHALCESVGVSYLRLPVPDHMKPDDATVAAFVRELESERRKGTWLHFHCHAGKGRTTTFLTLDEILARAGAEGVTLDSILYHQHEAGGADLRSISAPDSYKHAAAIERLDFLRAFFETARAAAASARGTPATSG